MCGSINVGKRGHVALKMHMGSDDLIAEAARQSFGGKPEAVVNSNQSLINYLMRHRHLKPFEYGEVVFEIKCPIYVMRHFQTYRTGTNSEASARHALTSGEYETPETFQIRPQSKKNKQGTGDACDLPSHVRTGAAGIIDGIADKCEAAYDALLKMGVAREVARRVCPVMLYTKSWFKIDIRNLFHLLEERCSETRQTTQKETMEFADAMRALAAPLFPSSFEAWEKHILRGYPLSQFEVKIIRELLGDVELETILRVSSRYRDEGICTGREQKEFLEFLKIPVD